MATRQLYTRGQAVSEMKTGAETISAPSDPAARFVAGPDRSWLPTNANGGREMNSRPPSGYALPDVIEWNRSTSACRLMCSR
jgi:hypothetical protein